MPVRSDHAPIPVDSLGSFISTYGDVLLIGDFARRRSHPVPAHHAAPDGSHEAWTAVYYMDATTVLPASTNRYAVDKRYTVLRPDAVLHHRERAQGIAVRDDGVMALSLSYGNTDSEITFYRLGDGGALLQGPDRTRLSDGSLLPSWTLSEANRVGPVLRAPPGSEGVTWINGRLAVVFEGGAYWALHGYFARQHVSRGGRMPASRG